MKIAFDISPLTTGHKFRGTGFYTLHVKNALEKYLSKDHTFIFFTDRKDIPKDADIIHYPYFDPFSFSIPYRHLGKTVVTVLDLIPRIFPKEFPAGIRGELFWQRQKMLLKKISGIITDSDSAKQDIERLIGRKDGIAKVYLAAGEEFSQIHNAKRVQEIKKKYALPEKFALYVGDVTWNKNVPRIVTVAIGAHIPLVMVGKALVQKDFDRKNAWNKDLVKVERLIKDAENIYQLGYIENDDLVTLYNAAVCLVMPSLYEGFGLPILEAMACGCPVITSKEGSLAEVAGDAAYVVDAYDMHSISKGVQKVFSSVSLQKELTKKGLEQVKKFSWEKTAEETIRAYEKFLSSQ